MDTPPPLGPTGPSLSADARARLAEGRQHLKTRRSEEPEARWVRQAVHSFDARRHAVLALIILLGLGVLVDVVVRPGWILLFDAAVVASAVTLFRALRGFEGADRSGHPGDLEEGVGQLMAHIRLNVILGWVGIVLGGLLLLTLIGLLMAGVVALSGVGR